jgi:DNA-binding Xre family transcriptional regulator
LTANCAAKEAKNKLPPKEIKRMKSEEVKQLTTHAIEQLCIALSAGCTEELTRYLAAMSRFHR